MVAKEYDKRIKCMCVILLAFNSSIIIILEDSSLWVNKTFFHHKIDTKWKLNVSIVIGENTPKGVLDDFIYEHVVNERKPTIKDAKNDNSGRFVLCNGVFFDVRAYVMFVANDVFITGMALNECATEPLNFKFLKYGTGYFAGQFRDLLEKFIGDIVTRFHCFIEFRTSR